MNQTQDHFFLKETLKLAKKGIGWTNPNPMVGAVIVRNGKIIGKGYHKKVGLPHAEIEAFGSVKGSIQGTTLYINLEPCSHFGRTPPCVDEIIKAKISRVVCSTLDPNPKVCGKGVAKLKKAGIDVSVGILEDQARILNEAFFTFHEKNRPFIAIKFASSLDGKIATKTGDSKWITNEKAREFARGLRGQYQAVLVGINTVLKDDPHLGVRIRGKKDPLRIILDPNLRLPPNSQVLRDSNVLIVTNLRVSDKKLALLKKKNITILKFSDNEISLDKLQTYLKEKGIISLLVEGGGKTLGYFVDERLFDKVYAFYAPIVVGGEKGVSAIGGSGAKYIKEAVHLKNFTLKKLDDNMLMIGYPATF
ncbi:MAG: bifunctional diaminohydroxyphosphoribosylaminopyrimidine deaminase/5-amino-6-(5-phosphoribosylamino)uracil reductase RibD [Candidatus Levybacteria bacterium]|nr:bifunctional diaminohydroxyphosphoribosylaminopyrimidine deaminase/5-amino-6-(5-phosphoribosylamino)uracil reductase RibD [Candidatus Levybacteria bacterium]